MAINKIPVQLQNDRFRFVKLKPKSKIPFEKNWHKKTYSYKEIQSWINESGNYGIQGGYGDLIIIDADRELMSKLVKEKLPGTFTVKTPKQGFHYYYFCKDIKKKIVLKKGTEHFGEILSQGSQAVGVGSIHPDTGTKYQVNNDVEIAEVTKEQVFSILIEYISIDYPAKDKDLEIDNISIVDVLNKYNIQTRQVGDQLVCGHPVHGSETDCNFVVHPAKNVWHCFRCGTGGGALSLIAVIEKIIDCSEAKHGALRGDKFKKVLNIASQKLGFYMPTIKDKVDDTLLNEDELAKLEKRIKAIPHDTAKTKLPGILDPILKEMVELNPAQADAIIKYTIKEHFNFTIKELANYEDVLKSYKKRPKDSKEKKPISKDKLIEILHEEENNITIHPAQDFSDGIMTFSVKIGNELCIISSDKQLFTFNDSETQGFILKHDSVDTAHFSRYGIKSYIENSSIISLNKTYNKVYNYIKRYIQFPDELYLNFISLWVIGTYFFMIFRYYPYVWLNAEKGSGKTLLMEVLSVIAFNGDLITNPTESVIFRDISNNLITMFIDEVEQLRKRDKDAYSSIISLLNSGFNKSGSVKRSERTGKGNFVVKTFSAYSPKMFAGINDIDDVLQDRTVRIPLLRKKENEVIQRYKETTKIFNLHRSIRDDLYTIALSHAKEIADKYHTGESEIEGLAHLNNRELDIWEPILILANIIDAESENTRLTDMMEELSKKSTDEKQADSISQNETYKLLNILKPMIEELSPVKNENDKLIFKADEVFNYFKASEEYEWLERKNALTSRLKKVKIKSEQKRIDSEKIRVYIMKLSEFQDLCERFKI